MGERVAVTGAAGHLGRAVVARLLDLADRGEVEEVVALDRAPSPLRHPRLRTVVADVREPALGEHLGGCRAVVHLAFVVETGSRDPAEVQAINVGGTQAVVRAAIEAGAEQVVYASSIGAYGFHADNAGRVLDERAPIRGNEDFYYTRTKAEVERWLDEVEAAHQALVVTRLRPSLFVDPGSGRAGVLRGPVLLRIGGGDAAMHVTHQDDVADAVVLALRRRARGAFNLATEEPLPLAAFGAAVGRRTVRVPGAALRALEAAYALGLGDVDPAWLTRTTAHPIVVTSERARRELGWRPRWPTTGAVLRAVAGRPTACASPATRLVLGGAALASRLPGGLGMGAHVENESRSISGALNLVFTGPAPSEWHLQLDGGAARVRPGLAPDARAHVRMADDVFHALLAGRLAWTTAQMTGRVRFHGPGEFAFIPGLIVERFRALGRAEGLKGAPGRALRRLVARRAGLSGVSGVEEPR